MRAAIVISAGVTVLLCGTVARGDGPRTLERYPVCEASAALEGPCVELSDASARCIWVGDNEQDDEIYQYTVDASGVLTPASHFEIDLGKAEVGDIEALAADGAGVLVIGSHSRKGDCESDDDRVAVTRVVRDPLRAEQVAGAKGWADRVAGCDSVMVKLEDAQPGSAVGELRRELCAAIAAAEKSADAASGDKNKCGGETLNVEGAVTLADASGKPRLWLGLRGPLVGGRAVLLRVAPFGEKKQRLTFDGVATIDLGGRGIRELALAGDTLWGIAGCVPDCTEPSRLWRVPASAVTSGASITEVAFVANDLSPSAEGLVIQAAEKRAIILIDGDEGKEKGRCATPPQQMTLALP